MFWTGSQESHLGAEFHKAIAVANLSPQNIYDLGMAIMNIWENPIQLLSPRFASRPI